jgi:hypothetical protein
MTFYGTSKGDEPRHRNRANFAVTTLFRGQIFGQCDEFPHLCAETTLIRDDAAINAQG